MKLSCRQDSSWTPSNDKKEYSCYSPDIYFNGLNFSVKFSLNNLEFSHTTHFTASLFIHSQTNFFYDPPAVFIPIISKYRINGNAGTVDAHLTDTTGWYLCYAKTLLYVQSPDGTVALDIELSCDDDNELLPRS